MASDDKILSVLEILCEYYDNREPTDGQLTVYRNTLGDRLSPDITDEMLELAAYDWIARSKWFPKVTELRESVVRVREMGVESAYNVDPDGSTRRRLLYWQAMEEFNNGSRLDGDKAWLAYKKQSEHHPPTCPCRICTGESEAELWAKSCAEVAEWMKEDQATALQPAGAENA